MASPRTILHLDLDAFYASVEQLDEPSLRGRPVIVGGTSGRGVVCAASYEARKFGVRSAMPTARARRLCPEGVFLHPRFDRYGELSDGIFDIYRRYTPLVEPLSLDEAFLDVTASRTLHGDGPTIAAAIRAAVRRESGLTVSAGVAEVKMAAKIATDFGKPDGLTVVPAGGVAAFLAPLPIGRLWGVGEVTEAALRKLGVATIGDLARLPEAALAAVVGADRAHGLRELARGQDDREVSPEEGLKSVGGEETFEEDVRGEAALSRCLLLQSARVGRRLRAHGLRGRVVTLKVKYADFTLVTRRVTLARPTDDDGVIYESARAQLSRVDPTRAVRLAGVTVSGFEEAGEAPGPGQLDLFGGAAEAGAPDAAALAEEARRRKLNAAVDRLSDKFGTGTVKRADLAETEVREAWPSHRRRDRE
ncbi:MAG: DNA polymerase IV [Anaeromyxobacteraceae bacterium]|nr:DNA polymerase IV [Anaeromyxobacteraceae bacterium]